MSSPETSDLASIVSYPNGGTPDQWNVDFIAVRGVIGKRQLSFPDAVRAISRLVDDSKEWRVSPEEAEAKAQEYLFRDYPEEAKAHFGSNSPKPRAQDLVPVHGTDLLAENVPEPVWIITGMIMAGLSILAGRPKIGKSWLALLLAACKASGTKFLGLDTGEPCEVLYLALEDSKRRIQNRLKKLNLTGEGMHFLFSIKLMSQGGIAALERWLDQHPEVRLVVIDTYGRFRDPRGKNTDPYQMDVIQTAILQEIAQRRNIAIVVVHHDRKASDEDWLATISGTQGITGTADTIALLTRDRACANGRLQVTGRDIEDLDLALLFENCQWSLVGTGAQLKLSPERQKIIACLRKSGPMSPTSIHLATGIKLDTVRHALAKMGDFVTNTRHGKWTANEEVKE